VARRLAGSRHVVAHQATVQHFSVENALLAVMLVASLLRDKQAWSEEVRAMEESWESQPSCTTVAGYRSGLRAHCLPPDAGVMRRDNRHAFLDGLVEFAARARQGEDLTGIA
jgi:hypothetical protein